MIKKLGSISRTKSLHPRISAIRATHFSLLDSPRQMKPSTLFKPLSHNPTTAPFLAFRPGLSFKFGEFREIPSTRLRLCSFIFLPPLSAHTCIKGFLAILFPCEDSRHPLLPTCHSSALKLNHDQLIASLKRDLERLLRSWWILVWSIWDYKFWKTFVDYLFFFVDWNFYIRLLWFFFSFPWQWNTKKYCDRELDEFMAISRVVYSSVCFDRCFRTKFWKPAILTLVIKK